MPFSADDRFRGGMETLRRHGPEHFARISPGGKRRGRYTPKGVQAGGPSPSAVRNSQPQEQGA